MELALKHRLRKLSTVTLETLVNDMPMVVPAPIVKVPKSIASVKATPTHHTGVTTSTEERALALLGTGIAAEAVATALGVDASRISQLLSQEDFALKVADLRYDNLQEHNLRDGKYDSLEDDLLGKLKSSLGLMVRPETILKAISVINGAKRRGQSSPEQVAANSKIVTLVLPTQVVQQFATNINNQVIKVGDQELETMASSTLLSDTEKRHRQLLLDDNESKSNVQNQAIETK